MSLTQPSMGAWLNYGLGSESKNLPGYVVLTAGRGTSGGIWGISEGYSLMIGGKPEVTEKMRPIFETLAPAADKGWGRVGPHGSGHYVKMVHNGIEYGDMQLIAEVYDLLHRGAGLSNAELAKIFAEWNTHELRSYLIEITARILTRMDEETGKELVDFILDEAAQKGTGKWTSQTALDTGAPIPTINAAVESRILSSLKAQRVEAAHLLRGPVPGYQGDRQKMIDAARQALYASKITSYAQGLGLLKIASDEYKYDLNLSEIARIWRAGCIIRASLLDEITAAFKKDPALPNLLLDESFRLAVENRQESWRYVVQTAVGMGIPVLALSASLAYFDAYHSERLPANLTQAQRDYFGAHTYRRVDREGTFHTEWNG